MKKIKRAFWKDQGNRQVVGSLDVIRGNKQKIEAGFIQ